MVENSRVGTTMVRQVAAYGAWIWWTLPMLQLQGQPGRQQNKQLSKKDIGPVAVCLRTYKLLTVYKPVRTYTHVTRSNALTLLFHNTD